MDDEELRGCEVRRPTGSDSYELDAVGAPDDVKRALRATMDVFERFEHETAAQLDFAPPPNRGAIRGLVGNVLGG